MAAILKIRGITKTYPGVRALQDVSFDVEQGSIHAIMGENGAGKSTLMQIIAGAQRPDSGTIEFDGREVRFASPAEAQAVGIAIVYQELNLSPNLSIAENVFLGLEPRAAGAFVDRKTLRAKTSAILHTLGIHFDPDTIVGHLTVAQQQLVEICKSLVRNPRLLIFDEPTSSLSEADSRILFRVIADLKAHGVTMLYISHRFPEVFANCDVVTVLRDGKHVRTKPMTSTSEAEVVSLMVGRELLAFHRQDPAPSPEVMFEVRGLTKRRQYSNVSFKIHRGEIVALAGLVGAGRSEVALGVFGCPAPDAGEIRVQDRPVRIRRAQDAMRAGIALAPEDRKTAGLVLGASVGTNISMAALPRVARGFFVNRGAERTLIRQFVSRLNIRTPSHEQRTGLLSGGNQQKVMIAKWLAVQPKCLIVDEPTRGVDVGTKAEIYTLFDELARAGVPILMISSDLPEVLALADRIVVMRQGRITGELTRADATEEKIMHLAALGTDNVPSG
ncbi:MAG: sugar ABC transporter ATP-binding protein [Verrucomicrobia bacterium]|nr:sugar ABC transporter ATP-binding protein [Verrucomicrobiota bacterium]